MARRIAVGLTLFVLSACGSAALRGTLGWQNPPKVSGQAIEGTVINTTSHAVDIDPSGMRLLDANGRTIKAHFRVGRTHLPGHTVTTLRARWTAGKPVRIDYGQGTLSLPSD